MVPGAGRIRRRARDEDAPPTAPARRRIRGHRDLMNLKFILHNFRAARRYALVPFERRRKREKPTAVILGFSPWKTFIPLWLPDYDIKRQTYNLKKKEFRQLVAPILLNDPKSEVFAWGYKEPTFVRRFCEKHAIPINRVEDGFLRSIQLGATKTAPLSIVIEKKALYFDATGPSTLEDILNTHDFDADPELTARARRGIDRLLETGLSKYNVGAPADVETLYGPKTRERILVVGQVEGDMSIRLGCDQQLTNNQLVWIAKRENPDAQIIYKPHPEVLRGIRKDPPQSDPRDVIGVAQVLLDDIALADAFRTVDRVYTMTSLSGFEALLRGIPVTCFGAPFYAGWGLTEDRQETPRRGRQLTVEQVFAAAYILYPRYLDPVKMEPMSFEAALDLLAMMKEAAQERERVEARMAQEAAARRGAEEEAVLDYLRRKLFPNLVRAQTAAAAPVPDGGAEPAPEAAKEN